MVKKRKIAHVINPFKAPESSDLFIAQPVTFHTMMAAQKNAGAEVSLFAACYEEDREVVPEGFVVLPFLTDTVLNHHSFQHPVRLPLIREILEKLYLHTDAEYLVYTNVDIALYPDFYNKIQLFIDEGHDAFIINRRRISTRYTSIDDCDKMMQEEGKTHPGFDCFVFHRSLYPRLVLEDLCIGVPFFEISFSQNLFALADHFRLYDNERLTFHIGMEIFARRQPREYLYYNRNEYYKIIEKLKPVLSSKKFPYSRLPVPFRWIKWGLHPCIPIRLAMQLEWKRYAGK